MELFLDSADLKEIELAFKLDFLAGLTTTPTFMHREGITDIDNTILKLSKMVPLLQVEALGENASEICREAERLLSLGLDKNKTVFKIPVSLEGVKACKMLRNKNILVNIHLVYTLQQAYMAMAANATYICPLVGRLQDQGHDALALVEECVNVVNFYDYDTKIMFSSVRNPEHVRNALNLGADACTVPWKVLKMLTENNFTTLGTEQFFEHTRLMTNRVKDVIRDTNPVVSIDDSVTDAIIKMTESGFGAVSIIDKNGNLIGIFTDGDLRRHLQIDGRAVLQNKMSLYAKSLPLAIDADAMLIDASDLFKKAKVDNIIVIKNNKPVGILDIQDLVKSNLSE